MQGATNETAKPEQIESRGERELDTRDGVREVVGTCTICRGPVTKVALFWPGEGAPKRQCEGCGALAAQPYGDFVEMEKP